MSERSIKTMHRTDFDAIFRVIGAERDTERYWQMMRVIAAAHHSAGSRIRKRLLHQVQGADLTELQRDGRMNFGLPEELGGGSLIAIRIARVAPELIEVEWSKVHRLITLAG
jgi:phosphomannomutase